MNAKIVNFRKLYFRLFFLIIIVGLGFGAFYFWIIKPSDALLSQAGQSIADGIAKVYGGLTPRVSINSTVLIQEHVPIFEIAVLKQNVYHDFFSSNTWLGSTKELHLKGSFVAKVGFDLAPQARSDTTSPSILVQINESSRDGIELYRITLVLPPPRLLSFETERYEVVKAEDGWWNNITRQDFEAAVNTMNAEAREKSLHEGILEKAKQSVQARLEDIVRNSELRTRPLTLKFIWQEANTYSGRKPVGDAILR